MLQLKIPKIGLPDKFDLFQFEDKIGLILFRGDLLQKVIFPVFSRSEAAKIALEDNPAVQKTASHLSNKLFKTFKGIPQDFSSILVDYSSYTSFEEKALRETRNISYGETISYSQLSAKIGSEKACRAVGQALKKNMTPIIIPCHRVISANGPGGFSQGADWKKFLLNLEQQI